jgi:hypothetical protein
VYIGRKKTQQKQRFLLFVILDQNFFFVFEKERTFVCIQWMINKNMFILVHLTRVGILQVDVNVLQELWWFGFFVIEQIRYRKFSALVRSEEIKMRV